MGNARQRNKYLDEHGVNINRALTGQRQEQLADLLYPQFDSRFANWSDEEMVLSREEAEWLRAQAFDHLKGNPSSMSDAVRSRVMHIVGGYFPIGFVAWWEVPEKP